MKKAAAAFAGIIIALIVSYQAHPDAARNARYHLGMINAVEERQAVEQSLKDFSRFYALLFNVSGDMQWINYMPADNLVKRKIIQEVNIWQKQGRILVYDRDLFDIRSVDFLNPISAVAITNEVWYIGMQTIEPRMMVGGSKANAIKVRYFLSRSDGRWVVADYEVFRSIDNIHSLVSDD